MRNHIGLYYYAMEEISNFLAFLFKLALHVPLTWVALLNEETFQI